MVLNRKYLILFILVIFTSLSILSYIKKSPTFDEIQHLSCGHAMLKEGRLNLGIGHPPLFRMFISLPLLVINPSYPKQHELFYRKYGNNPRQWSFTPDYSFAYDFFYKSGNNPDVLFFWGRFMVVLIGVFLGLGVYLFSKNLFGFKAGIFSLFLYSFSPTILAHARLTVNDLSGAAGIFFTLFAFHKYANKNNFKNLLILTLCLAGSLLTKFNSILFIPFLFIGMVIIDGKRAIIKYIILLIGIVLIINLIYGFDGTFSVKTLDYEIFKKIVPFKIFDKFAYIVYQYIPLPEFYLKCWERLFFQNINGHSAFILNNYSVHGWWYYFPVAFLIKTPLITLILCIIWLIKLCRPGKMSRGEVVVFSFFILYWISSIIAKINIGHRHILPLYPIMFVGLGRVYNEFKKYTGKKIITFGLPLIYIVSTQVYFPHYLSFFNCLVGPKNGYKYLVDSNLDWGQDLPALKKFLDKEGNPPLILSYFGTASRKHYNIKHQELLNSGFRFEKSGYINLPDVKKEYIAISATNLQAVYFRQKNIFERLRKREPIKRIGYSIFVYDISKDLDTIATIGEIYRTTGKYEHAIRQYKRLIYLEEKGKVVDWARSRIEFIKQIKK